jgi:uncharacterized membrane protein YkoI
MRMTVRVLVVAIGTVLFIAGGLSPEHATDTRRGTARAATVVKIQRVQQPSASDRARQAAEAAVAGATAREVEREAGDDDHPKSAYEVELTRPDGATVEVDLDADFKVLATGRDDDRRGVD